MVKVLCHCRLGLNCWIYPQLRVTVKSGSNFDAVVQIAEKIDEALLEYQHRVASNEGMNRILAQMGAANHG